MAGFGFQFWETRVGAALGLIVTAVFERVIQIEPDDALNYLHAGLAAKVLNDEEKAVDYLEKAVQLDPLLEQPHLELVQFYTEATTLGCYSGPRSNTSKPFRKASERKCSF
jgi:tetratricopeptide (TPR) repeat protein